MPNSRHAEALPFWGRADRARSGAFMLGSSSCRSPFTSRARVGDMSGRAGHVKLFSPFAMNATPLGRSAILTAKPEYAFPADDASLSGREHVERYLTPVAEVLRERIKAETRVLSVGKVGLLKQEAPGDPARGKQPFPSAQSASELPSGAATTKPTSCSIAPGTLWPKHRWLGSGGIPAAGRAASRAAHRCTGSSMCWGRRRRIM